MWLSDSDLRSASYSDITGSLNEDKLWPSDLKQKWPSGTEIRSASLSEPIISDVDDGKILSIDEEEILPFDEEQNMVSMEDEKEINVISIDETVNDEAEAAAEHPVPIRRSFLSALGRRVLSAGRKLFCCGGCGRSRK